MGEGQHSEEVSLAWAEISDGGLQLEVVSSDVDGGVVGLRDVLVRLPDSDLVAGQGLLLHGGGDVPPGHPDGGGVDAEDLHSGGRLLGSQLESSLEKSFTLRAGAWKYQNIKMGIFL